MDSIKVTDLARGKWTGIHSALGIPKEFLNTKKHTPCPFCGGKNRYRYTNWKNNGGFICSSCTPSGGNGVELLKKYLGSDIGIIFDRIREVSGECKNDIKNKKIDSEKQRYNALELWKNSKKCENGDSLSKYMYNRLKIKNVSPTLRLMSNYKYYENENIYTFHECMVALIQSPDGKPVSSHRTYLTNDGYKADISYPKMLMPGVIPDGSAIRLAKAEKIMGIAEGIETAIAASILNNNIPVWSCISCHIMEKFVVPDVVEKLYIFADNDENFVGQLSAYKLANRLSLNSKINVNVIVPFVKGTDFCDVLNKKYLLN